MLFSTTITFDTLLRSLLVTTTDGTNTVYKNSSFNANHQVEFTSFPSSSSTETKGITSTYDGLKRLKMKSQSGGGTVTFDYLSNNRLQTTDAENNVTTTTYLAYDTPSYKQAIKIESPESVTTDIAINLFGNTTSITQSGFNGSSPISETEYHAYDSQNRLCQIARNDVGTTVIKRNTFGSIEWQAQGQTAVSNTACNPDNTVAATDKVSFTYDNLGNQRTISYGDGTPTITFTLDNNSNVKNIVGQGFSQSYNYNSLNLLEDETLTISGRTGNLVLDYDYDSLGNLSSLKYPDGSAKIDFAPNAFGQATQAIRTDTNRIFVKGGTNKATYYPNGSIDSFTYGNNIVHKTTLNNRLIPQQMTDKLGSTDKLNLSYTYDNNNNIKSLINTRAAGIYSLTDLTYDGLDRLLTTTGGNGIGSSSITYDGLGNIRTYSNDSLFNPSNLTYYYKNNFQLNYVNTTGTNTKVRDYSSSGSYDPRGNVKKNGNNNRIFQYNLANQMTSSGTNSYLYDGYNRRIKTQDSKGTSYSFYSQSGKLLYRETAEGGINYIFLGSKLVAKEGTGVVLSGSSIMNYKPFGESIEEPKDDVGYTGHKFDTDLGLSYMQARYYDPLIGRFLSNDPVGAMGHDSIVHGFNRYAYANNNPYKYIDPFGLYPEDPTETEVNIWANLFGWESGSEATEDINSAIDDVGNSVKEFTDDRLSVSVNGTAGFGLGGTASATVDQKTIEGEGVKLDGGVTTTAYGASESITANLVLIKPDANAKGPSSSTTVVGGAGLGGGLSIQWTPSFGVSILGGQVAGFSVSSKVFGGETRVLEKNK